MDESRYSLAGWLAITQAIIFPLAFAAIFVQRFVGFESDFYQWSGEFGPGDTLFLLFTAFVAYTFYMFRRLLNERYNYHETDALILISIWWYVLFYLGSLSVRSIGFYFEPQSQMILDLVFISLSMILIGIVDIFIAIKLLKAKDKLNDLIMVFAIISMTTGIAEVSVVLVPIVFIIIPIWSIVLGMIFLREKEQVKLV